MPGFDRNDWVAYTLRRSGPIRARPRSGAKRRTEGVASGSCSTNGRAVRHQEGGRCVRGLLPPIVRGRLGTGRPSGSGRERRRFSCSKKSANRETLSFTAERTTTRHRSTRCCHFPTSLASSRRACARGEQPRGSTLRTRCSSRRCRPRCTSSSRESRRL